MYDDHEKSDVCRNEISRFVIIALHLIPGIVIMLGYYFLFGLE